MSKFLLAALFANARRVDVSKFRIENTAILRLRTRKLIFLLFSKIKGWHQITYLPKSYLWRKNKGNRFLNLLPLDGRYFLPVAPNMLKYKYCVHNSWCVTWPFSWKSGIIILTNWWRVKEKKWSKNILLIHIKYF